MAETTFPGERRCVGAGIGRRRLGAVVVAASPVRDRQGSMTVRRTDVASIVTDGIVSAGPGVVCSPRRLPSEYAYRGRTPHMVTHRRCGDSARLGDQLDC